MLPLRAASGVPLAALVALTVALTTTSCRCNKPDGGDGASAGGALAPPGSALDDRQASGEEPPVDAGGRFLDATPKVELDPDGPIDAACTGREVSFAVAVHDGRCAIGSARAKALRAALEHEGGLPPTLRQEASVEADGRVSLRMINGGPAPLTLPLSWSAKLPAFTALAEDERHSVLELAPPRFDPSGADGGSLPESDRAHFARIVLPPGGAAVASVTVDPTIVSVLRRARDARAEGCPEGGPCDPTHLPKGRYVLHVGELLCDVEAGPPARVTWDLR